MSFAHLYVADTPSSFSEDKILDELDEGSSGFKSFMQSYSGCSFASGLYRVHAVIDIRKWTDICIEAFPAYRERVICFSSDWLGRQFAIDCNRVKHGERLVLMMEPGSGESLEIPVSFMKFHDSELVEYQEEALAANFYQRWRSSGGSVPKIDQCIGYKKPLFLGGQDEIHNLEINDMEVYWSFCAQLIEKIRKLPPGTPIRDVNIS